MSKQSKQDSVVSKLDNDITNLINMESNEEVKDKIVITGTTR